MSPVALGLLRRLEEAGFVGATVEIEGSLLIVKIFPPEHGRLLADGLLREALVREAKQSGFSRVALELP